MSERKDTTKGLISEVRNLLKLNQSQSNNITNNYKQTPRNHNKFIKDKDGKVWFVNIAGVASLIQGPDAYNQTSGQRGFPGTGKLLTDEKTMPRILQSVSPDVKGYDKNSQLYLNGFIRPGQSTGDEMKNIFAGLKTPITFDYQGCMVPPNNITPIILDASYGLNQNKGARNNRTDAVRKYISDNPKMAIYNIGRNTVNVTGKTPGKIDFGDPFPGKNKQMSITYKCGNNNPTTIVSENNLFDQGYPLRISCVPTDAPSPIILDASYGLNQNKGARNNRTEAVSKYISDNPNMSIYDIGRNTVNVTGKTPGKIDFGDPFPGKNKQMSITYKCGDNNPTTIVSENNLFDQGYPLNISCVPSDVSLTQCYYNALAKNLPYFGLGNVDKNTNLGTCYTGYYNTLSTRLQNPGIPIWKIDMNEVLGNDADKLYGIVVGKNGNVQFRLNNTNGMSLKDNHNFYTLCVLGKLPNANPNVARVFRGKPSNVVLFLSKGQLYLFRFDYKEDIPLDLRENPEKYIIRNLIYSSGQIASNLLNVGWDHTDISTGVSRNMITTTEYVDGLLRKGESIYSIDGKLKLTLNPNNTLVLYTGNPNVVGCGKDVSNNTYIGYSGVAVNQVSSSRYSEDDNLGKTAYVNRLGSAYKYDDTTLLHYTNKYVSNPGYTIKNIDSNINITKFNDSNNFVYDNNPESVAKCQKQCSITGSCVGTVIDNKSCYLNSKIDNNDVVYKYGTIMTLRVPKINRKGSPSYRLHKNSKFLGGGLQEVQATSVEHCSNICNKTKGCNGFQIDRKNNNGIARWYLRLSKPNTTNTPIPQIGKSEYGDVFVKNPPSFGIRPELSNEVNTINSNKFANYNILPEFMNSNISDVLLVPKPVMNEYLQTQDKLLQTNIKIGKKIDGFFKVSKEPYTSMYDLQDKYDRYLTDIPKLSKNTETLDKMVSNSSIHMKYMNTIYSILFIALCILLIIAFTISL
jgi:hypothetical protein